HCGS
ncbi:Protein of unknown function, partial [Gryllus bimaculatus]